MICVLYPGKFRTAALSATLCLGSCVAGIAQSSPSVPEGSARSWVEAAASHELRIISDDGSFPLRYRVRKVDAKGDTTREVIESRQGSVARLVQRNGEPITAAEDAAEKQRLKDILTSPNDFIKHHKRDEDSRQYSIQLVREMPKAMHFTYAPGQPQPPDASGPQIAIDFEPDPKYDPPTMICDALKGIQGRMWIDAKTRRMTRIEGSILHTVNFGWGGIVAKIQPGGSIKFEQANAGGERWVYSHLDEHITIKAMWVKTIPENNQMSAADFRLLPAPLSVQEAVHTLLAEQIPLR